MNEAPVLAYYDIDADVAAFSTTRHGGRSVGDYGELNINPYCGDDAGCVAKNKAALANELCITDDRIILPHQVHGTEIRHIASDFLALPENTRQMVLEGVDAVMTDVACVCVGVSTADCVPILLYDKPHHAVCAIHAGWRGTVARIAERAVAAMTVHYHTAPTDLKAVIGPSISVDAFEVGDEVYERFASAGFEMEAISQKRDKWHIDLWECNRRQLAETGIRQSEINVSGICTYGNANDYFSARRLGVNSGRIYTAIMLKETNDQ